MAPNQTLPSLGRTQTSAISTRSRINNQNPCDWRAPGIFRSVVSCWSFKTCCDIWITIGYKQSHRFQNKHIRINIQRILHTSDFGETSCRKIVWNRTVLFLLLWIVVCWNTDFWGVNMDSHNPRIFKFTKVSLIYLPIKVI